MRTIKNITDVILALTVTGVVFCSCKKDEHKPPAITLKTGAGYTSADATVTKNETVKVGITADKVEDDMLTYNVSYAYDNAATTTTWQTFSLAGSEQQHYDKDVTFNTRNQNGI